MKAWTLNPPTQSPGDLQHSWEQTKDVGVADALTDNVQQKDKDEEDKEDVDTEEASSLDQTQRTDEGKCTGCKCAKAGRFCGSSCGCSKYSACQNKA